MVGIAWRRASAAICLGWFWKDASEPTWRAAALCWTAIAKARSISPSVPPSTTIISNPRRRAAVCPVSISNFDISGLRWFTSKAIFLAVGMSSCSSSSRFDPSSLTTSATTVTDSLVVRSGNSASIRTWVKRGDSMCSLNAPAIIKRRASSSGRPAVERLFVDLFLEAHRTAPSQITLDLDATDDPLHGEQEGRFFHGYYKSYCYLPLY